MKKVKGRLIDRYDYKVSDEDRVESDGID